MACFDAFMNIYSIKFIKLNDIESLVILHLFLDILRLAI